MNLAYKSQSYLQENCLSLFKNLGIGFFKITFNNYYIIDLKFLFSHILRSIFTDSRDVLIF